MKHNDEFEYKVFWGCDLQTEHERYLTEKILQAPGICHRLSEGDQSLLYEAERGRQDSGSYGSVWCRASARSSAAASVRMIYEQAEQPAWMSWV